MQNALLMQTKANQIGNEALYGDIKAIRHHLEAKRTHVAPFEAITKFFEVTSKCFDVIRKCFEVIRKCFDVIRKCFEITPKCSEVTPKCSEVTPKCFEVTPQRALASCQHPTTPRPPDPPVRTQPLPIANCARPCFTDWYAMIRFPDKRPTPTEYAVIAIASSVASIAYGIIAIIIASRASADRAVVAAALSQRGWLFIGIGLFIAFAFWLVRRLFH
jgi:hypothetical protein